MAESYVAVNTFGWKRREIVILAQGCPPHAKLNCIQTMHDQSQIGK